MLFDTSISTNEPNEPTFTRMEPFVRLLDRVSIGADDVDPGSDPGRENGASSALRIGQIDGSNVNIGAKNSVHFGSFAGGNP